MHLPTVLIDVGGVLDREQPAAAAAEWSARLGVSQPALLAALFAGNDGEVLVGRTSEDAWWSVVRERLGVGPGPAGALRRDLESRAAWDGALVECLRGLRGSARTAVVSNAWPHMRTRLSDAGLLDVFDAVVLSCDVGCAKPDPRIYDAALRRAGARPEDALFIDDTAGHVAAARSLGMAGHVHTGTGETLGRIREFVSPVRPPG